MKLLLTFSFLLFVTDSFAQYFRTLPKGVRLGVVRNIQTSNIDSEFSRNKSETPLSYEIDANIQNLEGIDDDRIRAIIDILRQYPGAYDKLSAGTYKIAANAQLNIMGYGLAYGLTDLVTVYTALPMYDARVRMNYQRRKGNTYEDTANYLQTLPDGDFGQGVGNLIEQLPDIDGSIIQSIATNTFGYNEVGDWSGQGPGDLEFGLMYNFYTAYDYGFLLTLGGVAPTGYVNDPDTLQDIGFGDGQWDGFVEFGGSYILNSTYIFNAWARYTHQFGAEKELRVPMAKGINISDQKATFYEKLGNIMTVNVDTEIIPSDWYNFQVGYIYESIGKSQYESDFTEANDFLAYNSESSSHNIRLKAELSSVGAFTKNKFGLPAQLKFFYQHMVSGINTPKVDRFEVEFRMFF